MSVPLYECQAGHKHGSALATHTLYADSPLPGQMVPPPPEGPQGQAATLRGLRQDQLSSSLKGRVFPV